MASHKSYLDYILDQLSDLEEISYKPMMGEYIIYYRGKVIGGIYDDRFLLKPVKLVLELMPEARFEIPYEGARQMLLADNTEDRELLSILVKAVYNDLSFSANK